MPAASKGTKRKAEHPYDGKRVAVKPTRNTTYLGTVNKCSPDGETFSIKFDDDQAQRRYGDREMGKKELEEALKLFKEQEVSLYMYYVCVCVCVFVRVVGKYFVMCIHLSSFTYHHFIVRRNRPIQKGLPGLKLVK